ncbi:hypothetical protein R3398_17305 [Rossellomorea marisflavi]|uniref:hypothetical protein n=1 Tax=Rossellomorea marisflavi TaxID=189381 RepID=UPI00296EC8E2|nr:hypothetical protein [Rossellomorea marisflavi]MDW4528126.1 hypothetical protein [Rossellomorea marisflavi]
MKKRYFIFEGPKNHQSSKSAVERRTADSHGNRGKIETLQASAEAAQLTPRRKAAVRSERERSHYHHSLLHQQEEETELNTTPPHPSPNSVVQRRTADSRGKRGKVETLQAQAEAAQLPPRRKAAGRSETERSFYHDSPLQQQEEETELNIKPHPSFIEKCSAAEDG